MVGRYKVVRRRVSDIAERGELMKTRRGLLMLGMIYKDMMIIKS